MRRRVARRQPDHDPLARRASVITSSSSSGIAAPVRLDRIGRQRRGGGLRGQRRGEQREREAISMAASLPHAAPDAQPLAAARRRHARRRRFQDMRSGGRVVEGARLESEYTSKAYRGFESLPLRQTCLQSHGCEACRCRAAVLLPTRGRRRVDDGSRHNGGSGRVGLAADSAARLSGKSVPSGRRFRLIAGAKEPPRPVRG